MIRIFKFLIRYMITLGCVLFHCTLGLLFKKGRSHFWKLSKLYKINHFMGDAPTIPPLVIKTVSSNTLSPNFQTNIAHPEALDGNVSTLELLILNHLILLEKPNNIFEIGTFNGRTTLNFALNSPPHAKVYTLDLPQENIDSTTFDLDDSERSFVHKDESGALYKNTDLSEKNKIIQLYGDSGNFDFSSWTHKIDFIFIDGSHTYDYIMNDSKIALKLLRKNQGTIVWHDYNPGWPDVAKALNDLCLEEPFSNMIHIENTSLVYLKL